MRPIIDKLMATKDQKDGVHILMNHLLVRRKDLTMVFHDMDLVIEATQSIYRQIISYFHVLSFHIGTRRFNTLLSTYYYISDSLRSCTQFIKGCY